VDSAATERMTSVLGSDFDIILANQGRCSSSRLLSRNGNVSVAGAVHKDHVDN